MDEPARKMKVTLPGGIVKEGSEVHVISSDEKWNEWVLEDGSVIRVKLTVMRVIRIDGEYDPEGNPLYVTQTAQVMVVNAPDVLKKGG
jgi:hypothetical protein